MTFEPVDGEQEGMLPGEQPIEEESNDYRIEIRLEIGNDIHRAEIEFQDGQPFQVTMGYYGDKVPAGLVRLVQQLLHGGSGPSFRAIGQMQGVPVAAPQYPVIPRVAGPSALY